MTETIDEAALVDSILEQLLPPGWEVDAEKVMCEGIVELLADMPGIKLREKDFMDQYHKEFNADELRNHTRAVAMALLPIRVKQFLANHILDTFLA